MPSRSKPTRPGMASGSVGDVAPLPRIATPLARRFQQICVAMLAQALAGEAVGQAEIAALVQLELDPGIDQRRLAETLGIDRNNMSLMVERLHAMGLIERRVSATDRRARALMPTRDGKDLWRRLIPKTRAANERILAPLSPAERDLFLDLLIRLIEGNRAHARPGAGRRARRTSRTAAAEA